LSIAVLPRPALVLVHLRAIVQQNCTGCVGCAPLLCNLSPALLLQAGGDSPELPFPNIAAPEYGENERPQAPTGPQPDNPLPDLPPNQRT
jgi:hypothetical protein